MPEQKPDLENHPSPDDKANLNEVAPREAFLTFSAERGGAVIRPEDEGKIKGLAVRAMEEQTQMQLGQIREQYDVLLRQAQDLERRRELSVRIYEAMIRFEPLIGRVYYLYHHNDYDVLSLIAPNEWGRSKKYEQYVAKLKLLADHTWDVLD